MRDAARRNWKYKQKEMALQQQYALEQMSKSAEYQLAHDKQMFDYQNAYNDPSAVLARNLTAGLNPAAVLGQSGVGVSATIPTSSGGAPSGHGPVASGSGGGISALAGNPAAYADIQLKDAQQERERSAAALNDAEADWYKSQTLDKDLRERLMKAQAGLAEAGITESSSRASLNAAITLSYSIDNELKDAAFGYNLEIIKANLGKAKEEYYQLKARTGYIDDLIEHAGNTEWGYSCYSIPEIITTMRHGAVFFSNNKNLTLMDYNIKLIVSIVKPFSNVRNLKIATALYQLTASSESAYADVIQICDMTGIPSEKIENVLTEDLAPFIIEKDVSRPVLII